MENEKKNSGILVGILVGLVIALLIVVCLFATGTISFKTTATNDNGQTSENSKSIKVDESKDYVYDAEYKYDNKYTEFDRVSYDGKNTTRKIDNFGITVEYTDGMQYLRNLKVPFININSIDGNYVNEQIEKLYINKAKEFDSCAESMKTDKIGCSQILTYRTYKYNDILSVVIIDSIQGTSHWILNYNIYNFDLSNGKKLDYYELLNKLGYNETVETTTRIEELLHNKMQSLYGKFTENFPNVCYSGSDSHTADCYSIADTLLVESINNNTILFFANDKGILNVLPIAYYDGVQDGTYNHYLIEVPKN